MTGSLPQQTVTLEKNDLVRLITPGGLFWDGCRCEECEGAIKRIAKVWPDIAIEIRQRRREKLA